MPAWYSEVHQLTLNKANKHRRMHAILCDHSDDSFGTVLPHLSDLAAQKGKHYFVEIRATEWIECGDLTDFCADQTTCLLGDR